MNGFWLLLLDELKHLKRVRYLNYIWISVPLVLSLIAFLSVDNTDIFVLPINFVVAMLCILGCIGTGAVLTSTLISDISTKAIVPFLVRPVSKTVILFSRMMAVVVSLTGVLIFSVLITNTAIYYLFSFSATYDQPLSLIIMRSLAQIICTVSLGVILGTSISSIATGTGAYIILCMQMHPIIIGLADYSPNWFGDKPILIGAILVFMSLIIMWLSLIKASKLLKDKN